MSSKIAKVVRITRLTTHEDLLQARESDQTCEHCNRKLDPLSHKHSSRKNDGNRHEKHEYRRHRDKMHMNGEK